MSTATWVDVFRMEEVEDGVVPAGTGPVLGDDGLFRPAWAMRSKGLLDYYDAEWGTPQFSETSLFRTFSLLVLQAGLYWGATLGRARQMAEQFDGFSPDLLAVYDQEQIEELLLNPRVIRNRRKIESVVANAKATLALRDGPGLASLVWGHRPEVTPRPKYFEDIPQETAESARLARELKNVGFRFVGPRLAFALMQSAGVVDTNLLGAHRRGSSGLWNEDGTRAKEVRL